MEGSDPKQFILLPGVARRRYRMLLEKQAAFVEASEASPYNVYVDGPDKKMGIIACGIAYNYLMESYPEGCEYPVLKIGQLLLEWLQECDRSPPCSYTTTKAFFLNVCAPIATPVAM